MCNNHFDITILNHFIFLSRCRKQKNQIWKDVKRLIFHWRLYILISILFSYILYPRFTTNMWDSQTLGIIYKKIIHAILSPHAFLLETQPHSSLAKKKNKYQHIPWKIFIFSCNHSNGAFIFHFPVRLLFNPNAFALCPARLENVYILPENNEQWRWQHWAGIRNIVKVEIGRNNVLCALAIFLMSEPFHTCHRRISRVVTRVRRSLCLLP